MAEVKESIKEIAEADLVPETDYMLRVLKVRDAGQWEVARCGFVDPKDQDLVGRTVDFFIGKEGQWRGLSRLLKAAQLTELPLDDNKRQDTKTSLIGVQFPANISRREGKQGPENSVSPNIDYAWVETQMAESDGAGRSKKKKGGGRQKSTRSSETRTRRRRS